MNAFRLLPVILAFLLLGAHFLRSGQSGLTVISGLFPLLLFIRRGWIVPTMQIGLLVGAILWIDTALEIIAFRRASDQPWIRFVVISGAIIILTASSALLFRLKSIRERYRAEPSSPAIASAFILTFTLLSIVQLKVRLPMLLMERFLPGFGWIEILLLSVYSAWITGKMLDPAQTARWRKRIWTVFTIVFFSQLALGLLGLDRFLMTDTLHLPVPAMILAGPLFRGDGFFMPILFGATVLLVGPAWCSHLCYIGAWDNLASDRTRKPRRLPAWTHTTRIIILTVIIVVAIALRLAGASITVATILGAAFGMIGVAIMLIWSRQIGVMTHCTAFCPIGLLANLLGKLSPFRLCINDRCTDCGICRLSCRYDALNMSDIKRRRPGLTCTLCGDCLHSCTDRALEYRFFRLYPTTARAVFIVLVVSLHAVCLGLALI
ncbi:MAG: 4Fe-4S binding protein [candidate division Zixibacteria bacterium]|nr:4Fe-4S binding protein [candidate division Zixibacteria bacterium]